jgi:ketosteroid isomerase-like protein
MTMSTLNAENREVVRTALEQVCARGDMALAPSCYAEDFVDHVGRLEYRGLEGVRRSTAFYRALLDGLAFEVVDQFAEGDRVATRFCAPGPTGAGACVSRASRSAACATGASSRTGRDSTASSFSGSSDCGAA